MKKQKKITVLIDEGTVPDDDPEFYGVPEKPTTEHHVIQALR